MKVMFDYQALQQRYGGVSRYYYALYKEISALEDISVTLPVSYSRNEYFRSVILPSYDSQGSFTRRFHTILNQGLAIHALHKGVDIIHPAYYSPYFLRYKGNYKLVCTIYDMIHERFPEMFSDAKYAENKRTIAHAADQIIAISESTKEDILHFYPDISEEKVTVIPLSHSLTDVIPVKPKIDISGNYILYVGERGYYKNFATFYHAITQLLNIYPHMRVIFAGGGAFTEDEKHLLAIHIEQGRVSQYSCTDAELAFLYSQAVCFVYPSLYEGFGIPTLEAFYCNCPVILCAGSSLSEVGGDAALYFDKEDHEQLLKQMCRLAEDDALRQRMIASGRERLQAFSWRKTARETVAVYRKVLTQ